MATTKHQKLAEQLKIFLNTIDQDFKKVNGAKLTPESDSFCKEVFYDCWLNCETTKVRQNRISLHAAAYELDRQTHAVYYEQYQKQGSQLWKNLSSPAAPIYSKWLKECPKLTESGLRSTTYKHPFSPIENECLEIALRKVVQFLEQKTASRYFRDLAISYYKILVISLFEKTGIRVPEVPKKETAPAYGLKILRDLGVSLERIESWEEQKFLKILPGRYAISRERAQLYLMKINDKFLEDPIANELLGETTLVLWILLACAMHKRRFCSVADILKICEADISTHKHKPWHELTFLPTYSIKIKDQDVPLSTSLTTMLLILSDQRAKKKQIIQVDRSSIEGYLHSITEELGFNHEVDPVTPETFLERPHHFGENVRHRPKNV